VVETVARVERPPVAATPVAPPPLVASRIRVHVNDEPSRVGPRGIAYGLAALLIILLGWYFVHSRSASPSEAVQKTPAPAPVAQENAPVAAKSSAATVAGANPASSAAGVTRNAGVSAQQNTPGDSRGHWRVIAFTYSREDQAQQKVAEIAQSHPDLNPTVFAPNGHGPFLVTLGGPMSMEDAFAFSGKAKREGMPKDTYAQNYRRSGN